MAEAATRKKPPGAAKASPPKPAWLEWGDLRQTMGEILGRLMAVEKRQEELRQEIKDSRNETNARFSELSKKQDRLLYLVLAVTLGMIGNLLFFILRSRGL